MARTCSIQLQKLDWQSFMTFEFCFEILNIEHGNLVSKKCRSVLYVHDILPYYPVPNKRTGYVVF